MGSEGDALRVSDSRDLHWLCCVGLKGECGGFAALHTARFAHSHSLMWNGEEQQNESPVRTRATEKRREAKGARLADEKHRA